MPCSYCKCEGHNRRTCPQIIKDNHEKNENINKTKSSEYSEMIKHQNNEYQLCLENDLKKQKEKELAEPTLKHLRELRLQHFMKT
tara:strand:+ start:427 stop:681 length:255 start_codon:yes stop_codon:yes gene_type:complete